MEEHRRLPRVHLIPDEENTNERTTVQHPIANTAHASPLDVCYDSSAMMQRVGSSVIHHQAAIINRRLLAVQKRAHDACDDTDDEDEPPRQRLRRDTATPDDTNDDDQGLADQEQVSIVRQVERMKRMSFHLKNARIAQELFLRDMQECLQECSRNI